MPDSNGLSSWAERDNAFHLRTTLEAMERAFHPNEDPKHIQSQAELWMSQLKKHNIGSIEELAMQCWQEQGLAAPANRPHDNDDNDDDDEEEDPVQLVKVHPRNGHSGDLPFWKDPLTLSHLTAFLPSPLGFQCLRLAEQAVQRRENGTAQGAYVHRGSKRGEKWVIDDDAAGCWTLDVDCAGFVRHVVLSVTGTPMLVSLSDRDYMRAKDYYTFFERLETTVTHCNRLSSIHDNLHTLQMQWCRVDDLRCIMEGDIIVYRAKGGAAGGSVFTKKDCLYKALTAVKTAEMYDIVDGETGDQPVDINVARLPEVKEWVSDVMEILQKVGIESIEQLRGDNDGANDEDNDDNLQAAVQLLEQEGKLSDYTVSLLQEVLSSNNGNTGHIMFAAGPAEETSQDTHIWRVPVYHSTGVGPKKKRGVQRAYKRFEYSPIYQKWTRGGPRDDVEGDHIEVVVGRLRQ